MRGRDAEDITGLAPSTSQTAVSVEKRTALARSFFSTTG
jgi:hypothetical protein